MKTIFRCGWCGHPTDKHGNCIREPAKYLEENQGAKEILVNGECCPNGDEPVCTWDKLMDGDGVHW